MKTERFKEIIKITVQLFTIGILMFVMFFSSCDNMNSIHEKYLERGETLYLGAVDSIMIYTGKNKIKFEWKINSDPRISNTVIYWNKRSESVTIPVNRTTGGDMWLEALLEDMEEGEYIFEFEMQDDLGNVSKPIEISGEIFGDLYVENLRNRGIKELSKLETGDMQIVWDAVNSRTLKYSVVEYFNRDKNEYEEISISNEDNRSTISGLETGDKIELYSMHLPEDGLEEFMSIKRSFIMPKFERELNKNLFIAAFKPGDNTTPHPGGGAKDYLKPITDFGVGQRSLAKIWDGGAANNNNGKTILHTEDQSGNANARFKYPHHFTIDLGKEAILSKFRIWARADNGAFTGHSPRFIEVWAVDKPKQFEDFISEDEFEKYYKTTYVDQKDPNDYLNNNDVNYLDRLSKADSRSLNYVAPAPEPGINNWQNDWIKLGDFELNKPSGGNHGSSNDADRAVWGNPNTFDSSGFECVLEELDKKVRYIRILVKFPNWDNTNCINIGEISLYGDDI